MMIIFKCVLILRLFGPLFKRFSLSPFFGLCQSTVYVLFPVFGHNTSVKFASRNIIPFYFHCTQTAYGSFRSLFSAWLLVATILFIVQCHRPRTGENPFPGCLMHWSRMNAPPPPISFLIYQLYFANTTQWVCLFAFLVLRRGNR